MDINWAGLSEDPVTPAHDSNIGRIEHFFSIHSLLLCRPVCVEQARRSPIAQGLMGPLIVVEPEV